MDTQQPNPSATAKPAGPVVVDVSYGKGPVAPLALLSAVCAIALLKLIGAPSASANDTLSSLRNGPFEALGLSAGLCLLWWFVVPVRTRRCVHCGSTRIRPGVSKWHCNDCKASGKGVRGPMHGVLLDMIRRPRARATPASAGGAALAERLAALGLDRAEISRASRDSRLVAWYSTLPSTFTLDDAIMLQSWARTGRPPDQVINAASGSLGMTVPHENVIACTAESP